MGTGSPLADASAAVFTKLTKEKQHEFVQTYYNP